MRLALLGLAAGFTTLAVAAIATDSSGPTMTATTQPAAEARPAGGHEPPASVFVSTSGSDGGACSRSDPCKTLHAAYNAAHPGQVVEVAAGRYPGEVIRDLSGAKAAPKVVIRPAPGARVSFTGPLELSNVRQLLLRDLIIERFPAHWSLLMTCVSDLTLENVGGGRRFGLGKGTDVTIEGGEWGRYGTRGEQDSLIGGGGSNCLVAEPDAPSRRVVLDGVTFRDVFWGQAVADFSPESHPDCLQLESVDGLTIRRSRFLRCAQVFVGFYGDGDLRNVLIENNVFAKLGTDSYYGTVLEDAGKPGSCADVTFRYNTHDESGGANGLAAQGFGFLRINCRGGGVKVLGNVFHAGPRADSCGLGGARWTHNVYERAASAGGRRFLCGRKASLARGGDAGFVGRARNDYRLRVGAHALDRGTRAEFPRLDLRGQRRYSGRAPDAGAYERVRERR